MFVFHDMSVRASKVFEKKRKQTFTLIEKNNSIFFNKIIVVKTYFMLRCIFNIERMFPKTNYQPHTL